MDYKEYASGEEIPPLRLAGTVEDSIVDGPGIRYTIFVQGCPHHCPGCHNPQTHPFEGGFLGDIPDLLRRMGENPLLQGLTISGGEPFCQPEPLAALGRMVRATGGHVMTYTGYVYEDLLKMAEEDPAIRKLLDVTNVLVDGPYVEELRDLTLEFRGSSNQRLINLDAQNESTL